MGLMMILVIGVPILFIVGMYNSLIGKKNMADNAFAGIDAMLKKRYDLIPNLVATVQQYMQHERGTLKEITELRAQAISGKLSDDQKVALNNKIAKAMNGIMVAVENYPDLKANTNFMQLQSTLTEIEEQLSAARRAFNAAITDFNNAIEMFPSSIIAGMMNYQRRQLFEIVEAERQNINVKNLFNN
ncbi:MAG: LemA family protein [Candidatus Omnitrophota bacterium]